MPTDEPTLPGKNKRQYHSTNSLSRRGGSNLYSSSGSLWSLHSGATAFVQNNIAITGCVCLTLNYDNQINTLQVHIAECRNIAPADSKKKNSNPYVKVYLQPDKIKRRTVTKKKTLDPVYGETLTYKISESELATRTLNVSVWHDKIGINSFLGEAIIHLDEIDFYQRQKEPTEYALQPKGAFMNSEWSDYRGDIELALRFRADTRFETSDLGQLDIVVKKVKNIPAIKANSNIFVKSYFLPDKQRQTKQKSPLATGVDEMQFDHLFSYTNVNSDDLQRRCLELTAWNQTKMGSNTFVGGVRLSLGADADGQWDSNDSEASIWKMMMTNKGAWVEGALDLRTVVFQG